MTGGHIETAVSKLPKCQFCDKKAAYDGKTVLGPWGYVHALHFGMYGTGLGLGRDQKLVKGRTRR